MTASNEIEKIIARRRKLITQARYKDALRLIQSAVKKYPESLQLKIDLAVLIGDTEEGLSASQRQKNHKTAAKMLREALRRSRSLDELARFRLRNEYYWFSHQPKKQYELGRMVAHAGYKQGFYSQGVGAIMIAEQYLSKRQPKLALRWLDRAEAAWRSYMKKTPNYYNAHCWLAKALGLKGDIKGMEKSLQQAAKLSGRKLNYFEFEEVRKEVKKFSSI